MRKPTPKTPTKRERKAIRGPNAAVMVSMKHGDEITIAKTNYVGRDAEYQRALDTNLIMKVRKGIPYVRVHS